MLVQISLEPLSQIAYNEPLLSAGGVAELADAHDLGSCLLRGEGSSPSFPNTHEGAVMRLSTS